MFGVGRAIKAHISVGKIVRHHDHDIRCRRCSGRFAYGQDMTSVNRPSAPSSLNLRVSAGLFGPWTSLLLLVWGLPHRVVAPRQEPKIPRSYTRIFRLDGTLGAGGEAIRYASHGPPPADNALCSDDDHTPAEAQEFQRGQRREGS